MNRMKIWIVFFLVLFPALLVGLYACKDKGAGNVVGETKALESSTAPRSLCGSVTALYLKDLGPAERRSNIGDSHIPITTHNPKAQEWFDQGLNLMHGFWTFESYRSFLEGVKADSTCAMCYWGIVMTLPRNNAETNAIRKQAIAHANQFASTANITDNERKLIEIATSYTAHEEITPTKSLMDAMIAQDPNNPELAAIDLNILNWSGYATDEELRSTTEKYIAKYQNHIAIQHYHIHIMERYDKDYIKALKSAEGIIKRNPSIAHLIHTPGHIFFKQGNYVRAINCFTRADSIDNIYHKAEKISYADNEQYLHNLHFLSSALSENGQKTEALAIAHKYADLQFVVERKTSRSAMMWDYEGTILPAMVHIRYRDWANAIIEIEKLLNMTIGEQSPARNHILAMLHFCKGMQYNATNQNDLALSELQELSKQLEALSSEFQSGKTRDFKSNLSYTFAKIIAIHAYELQAWLKNANPSLAYDPTDFDQALKLENNLGYFEPPRLCYPIYESMGQLFAKRGDGVNAKKYFALAKEKRPNSKLIK